MASFISLDETAAAFDISDTFDLHDPRFGSNGLLACAYCNQGNDRCLGHHASVSLGDHRIFHPLILKDATSRLNKVCIKCGTEKFMPLQKTCSKCNGSLYKNYIIHKDEVYRTISKDKKKEFIRCMLSAGDVAHVLPSGYVVSRVMIPPVYLRTPEDMEWSSDLQQLYQELMMTISQYPAKGKPPALIPKHEKIFDVYKKIIQSIMALVSGKDGICRKIMLGKRMESSARAVITPDPSLRLDEVAIPRSIAEVIRVPEICTRINQEVLRKIASEGRLFLEGGIDVSPRQVLQGMRFLRVVRDGDLLLFNRQPSLSRSSLMCFRARVRHDDYDVFGMHPQVVSPFNADFDGDEMNIFFLREMAEMREICHLSHNVVVDGKVILVPVQDVVTGTYMMSSRDMPVSRQVRDDCCIQTDTYDTCSTHGILRACIPGYDGRIVNKESLIKRIGSMDGSDALEMLYVLQHAVERWLSTEGLTVPVTDVTVKASRRIDRRLDEVPDEFRDRCYGLVEKELDGNRLMSIIKSGAKGSLMHAAHMAVALGQQYIGGNPGVFCENSYSTGLTPSEFFGHQMAAREGVVSTGIGTSLTGYINRRACKILADVKLQYNGTVGDEYGVSSFHV